MANYIKCILAGRGGSSGESLISLNISGTSAVKTQKAGTTFNPSGYSFKAITNMGKEQIISTSDSNLEFYTDDLYGSKILQNNTTTIYVKYKNVSNTINLAAEGISIEEQVLPITLKNGKWYLNSDYCPTYNGNEQSINYTVAGFETIKENSVTSATNVNSDGYKLIIDNIAKGWSMPQGYNKQEVYWNIQPAKASIDLQGISTLQIKDGKVIINDKVKSVTSDTFQESIATAVTGAQGFTLPISIVDSASSNITTAQLVENNTKLILTLKKTVVNELDCSLGSIRFISPNFIYSFKVNGIDISSSNNQIAFISNLSTTNIITDDWETIMNNPDNYSLGDIKILEAAEGYEIAGTSKWQMQLVDKTDGILTFYSRNVSNYQYNGNLTKQLIDTITPNCFKDFVEPINTNAYYSTDDDNPDGGQVDIKEQGRRQFFLGTSSQLLYGNALGFKKFDYTDVLITQNHWLDMQPYIQGNYLFYYDNVSKEAKVTLNNSYELPFRLGFKISKDTSASIPTISEGATLKDLSDFISAKVNGATTATYDSKGFIPGSRFNTSETFQLSDGTKLTGIVYIAAVDKTNNIVTLQSSYLKDSDGIYLIGTGGIFEKFQYQQNYKGSELENIYSNMQVLNAPNVIQQNTIGTQNYVFTSQSPVNKANVTVGTCYLPSAAECGITTATLKGVTYNIPVLGTKTSYPADIAGIKTIFDVSNSPSYWTRIRDNVIYNGGNNSAYVLCGINQGILIPAGWEDNNGTELGETQRVNRYKKIALTPRFRIGG